MTQTVFNKIIRITDEMADNTGSLKISSLFTLLHDAADDHLKDENYGKEKLLKEGLLWVIANQTATIKRKPSLNDTITVRTWLGKQKLTFSPRYYEVLSDNETIITASAAWAVMDAETRKICKPDTSRFTFPVSDMKNGEDPFAKVTSLAITDSYSFIVSDKHLDLNEHMNNARYFDEFDSFIPSALKGMYPHRIIARYSAEALCGDNMRCDWGCNYDGSALLYFITCSSERGDHLKVNMEY